jgi:hypothetical protein
MHPIQDLFLVSFSYVLQIDMHFICTPMWTKKIYSCKKWVLQSWLELIKDYDLGMNCHPRKANVLADTLSHRSHVSQLVVYSMPFELCEEFD